MDERICKILHVLRPRTQQRPGSAAGPLAIGPGQSVKDPTPPGAIYASLLFFWVLPLRWGFRLLLRHPGSL